MSAPTGIPTQTRGPGFVLPRTPTTKPDAEGIAGLRRFHLGLAPGDPAAVAGWRPLLPDAVTAGTRYPFLLRGGEGVEFAALVDEAMASTGDDPAGLLALAPRLREAVRAAGGALAASDALRQVGETTPALRALAAAAGSGIFLGDGMTTVPRLLARALTGRHADAREAFLDRRGSTAELLRACVDTARERRAAERDPNALRQSLGGVGGQFLDANRLSEVLGAPRGPVEDPARERALEAALAALEGDADTGGTGWVFHAGPLPAGYAEAFAGFTVTAVDDPCEAAGRAFETASTGIANSLRHIRVANLEIEGRYDPARHDAWLGALAWDSFTDEEMALVPPVVVILGSEEAADAHLASLSRLLRAERPVQVLLLDAPNAEPGDPGSTGAARFEPGYFGMSHRDTLVQQASPAYPAHLWTGFRLGAEARHPALHVVGTPTVAGDKAPVATADAAVWGRAFPLFHFDPEWGGTWARRLTIEGNPEPGSDWPASLLPVERDGGGSEELHPRFTFADFALLDPAHAADFLPVPETWASDELVPLDLFLAQPADADTPRIPVVQAVDPKGRVRRLAVTRRLARMAEDRLDFWRTLGELAGLRNPHVEAAAERARMETRAETAAKLARLQSEHAEEIRALRAGATEEAIRRLTALLLDMDPGDVPRDPGPGAALLAGSVEEVTERLLGLLDPAALDASGEGHADPAAARLAAGLLESVTGSGPAASSDGGSAPGAPRETGR